MTTDEMEKVFRKHDNDYLEWNKVEVKRSTRPDIHAFLLLNSLVPGTSDIVSGARYDVIILETDLCELAQVITEDQILELRRSGVSYGDGKLCMLR